MPSHYRDAVMKFNRQPHVTAINRIFWIPAICHENEGVALAVNRQNESGLGVECVGDLFTTTNAWVAEFFPRSKNMFRNRNARGVRCPTSAIGCDQKIFSVRFENRRRFVKTSGKDTNEFFGGRKEVIVQLREMKRAVVFGSVDVVRATVV